MRACDVCLMKHFQTIESWGCTETIPPRQALLAGRPHTLRPFQLGSLRWVFPRPMKKYEQLRALVGGRVDSQLNSSAHYYGTRAATLVASLMRQARTVKIPVCCPHLRFHRSGCPRKRCSPEDFQEPLVTGWDSKKGTPFCEVATRLLCAVYTRLGKYQLLL